MRFRSDKEKVYSVHIEEYFQLWILKNEKWLRLSKNLRVSRKIIKSGCCCNRAQESTVNNLRRKLSGAGGKRNQLWISPKIWNCWWRPNKSRTRPTQHAKARSRSSQKPTKLATSPRCWPLRASLPEEVRKPGCTWSATASTVISKIWKTSWRNKINLSRWAWSTSEHIRNQRPGPHQTTTITVSRHYRVERTACTREGRHQNLSSPTTPTNTHTKKGIRTSRRPRPCIK